jgi:hypothetical protein
MSAMNYHLNAAQRTAPRGIALKHAIVGPKPPDGDFDASQSDD